MRDWWRDPVDYRWLVRTFEARGALGPIKVLIAAAGGVMFVITVLTMISAAGPSSRLGIAIDLVTATVAGVWVVYWWLAPWPSERVSLLLMALANVLIAITGLSDTDHMYGAMAAVLFVVTGSYFTIFHGPRLLALHAAWCLLIILLLASRLLAHYSADLALAVAIVLSLGSATVVVLPAVHFCFWLLRLDALSDPLTGLFDRRGLDYYLSGWLSSCDSAPICVMTIDLDRFKAVNDTFGHSQGDQVLIRTANCLRAAARPGSIVARSGGEEFVIVERLASIEEAIAEAERVRSAIATCDSGTQVTASVGVAVIEGNSNARHAEYLLAFADAAMYRAKGMGGNAVVLAEPS